MVKKWFTEFHCGHTSTNATERSGRPTEVTTPETIERIDDMLLSIGDSRESHALVVLIKKIMSVGDGCRVC